VVSCTPARSNFDKANIPDLQPNNGLIELADVNSSVGTILNNSPRIAETIILADRAKYDVVGGSEFPLDIPAAAENWELNIKIADLGMGKTKTVVFCNSKL
jgi:hypothetical protein